MESIFCLILVGRINDMLTNYEILLLFQTGFVKSKITADSVYGNKTTASYFEVETVSLDTLKYCN